MLYGRNNGIAIDSSWRHKNENRAPLTLMVTVDNQEHMLPGEFLPQDFFLLRY